MKAAPLDSTITVASEYLFEAKSLKKEFDDGQVQALRGVDFQIGQGEFVAVIGPSGCGKTTLLQMLGALDRPSSGTLCYRGNSIADLADPAALPYSPVGITICVGGEPMGVAYHPCNCRSLRPPGPKPTDRDL